MKRSPYFLQVSVLVSVFLVVIFLAACSPTEAPQASQPEAAEALSILPAAGISQDADSRAKASGETVPESGFEADLEQLPQALQAPDAADSKPAEAAELPTAGGDDQPSAEASVPAFDGPLPPVDPTIGNLAPDFNLTTLDGETVNLEDLRGRPVVLNYWVTWCIPCRDEMPTIEALHQEYGDDGLIVLSVNGTRQDALSDVEQLIGDMGLSFPVLLDQREDVYNSYRILFMPTSFFIDAHGIIQDIVLGSTNEEGFRSRVEKLVKAIN